MRIQAEAEFILPQFFCLTNAILYFIHTSNECKLLCSLLSKTVGEIGVYFMNEPYFLISYADGVNLKNFIFNLLKGQKWVPHCIARYDVGFGNVPFGT